MRALPESSMLFLGVLKEEGSGANSITFPVAWILEIYLGGALTPCPLTAAPLKNPNGPWDRKACHLHNTHRGSGRQEAAHRAFSGCFI